MASITDNVTKVNFVNGSTTTTDLDLVKVNLNGTIYYKYVKAYTYSTGSDWDRPGYWGFRCRRGSSPYANASIGQINDGDTIYYGDTIYFVVNDDLEEIGFTLTPAYTESNQLTVTSDITGSNYITVNKARGRVWLTGWGEGDPTAITSVCVKVDNGNWVQYDNLPYDDVSVTVQETVYFDSLVQIYDIVNTGYTAQYTQSSPKQINMERDYQSISDGIYVYIYQAKPATCSFQFVKNTGVDKIYYRNSTSGSWTELSSTTIVNFNFGSTVQWYATAATGYTRDDSYTSSSSYQTFTVSVKQTINPTATINKYAVNFTLGSYVTSAFTSTNASATSGNASGTTYDYGTTVYYFVVKNADTTQYTYTCSGTHISGNVYRLGSVTVNGTKNLGSLSSVTRTTNKITYTIKVAAITSSMISPYYICSDAEDYDMMVAPGGLGNHVVKEFTVSVERAANLTEVYLSQSLIQQQLPGSYVYTGGTITFTGDHRDNPYLYVGVYVYDDDH